MDQGFNQLSIRTLSETAQINRQTFYAHFTDKYSLAESMIKAFIADMDRLLQDRAITADNQLNIAESSTILIPTITELYINRNAEVRVLQTITLDNNLSLNSEIQKRITAIFKLYSETKTATPFELELNVAVVMTILNHTIEEKKLPDLNEVKNSLRNLGKLFDIN
ncbi:TetR family transcriptional regulator [Pediococcus argentinicus]|uniref:TetR/AcrR family transcriptional regulator n=1 Tax=Pediococcus argentinicus TaxID=480391 RepID=UPI00338E96DE